MKKAKENWIGELKKIWGRTTVRGHTNWRETWPLWNRGKRLLSKIVQENASQKSDRYWTNRQNTALSCTATRPMETHQYWTVPRQSQRITIPSFAEKWKLQYRHTSKVMLQIILNRLKPLAEKIIAQEQAGFRAGRSATEQIFNLHILCEKYPQHQQDLYHVFIDFKKAFDRVWHAALWTTMKKYSISTNLI